MQQNMRKKSDLPSKQQVIERISNVEMSKNARSIIMLMVEHALFEYSMIVKQFNMALDLPKSMVENALTELQELKIVRQQVLYGKERTYVINQEYFLSLTDFSPPIRRTQAELQKILRVVSNE